MRRGWGLACSTLVLGGLTGVSSGLLSRFLDVIEQVFLGFVESPSLAGPFLAPAWRRLASVVVGGVIAAVIWYLLRNKTAKVPSVGKAVKGAWMPVWQTVVHVVTQIFLVATGASIGREVAPREVGALLGGVWFRVGRKLGLTEADRPLLVAAAAGAGFAGIYISPLTGALFGVEVLLGSVDLATIAVCLGMSSISALVGGSIRGFDAYYMVGSQDFSHWTMLFALVAGPLAGLLGAGFKRLTSWAESHQTTGRAILWQLPAVAALTGVVAMVLPEIMGNGRALAQTAMNVTSSSVLSFSGSSGRSMWTLVLLFATMAVWKIIATVFTIRAGASGGTLTPSIAIGAALGVIIALLSTLVVPGIHFWQAAVIGAAATLAASQQAPLMALMMVFEVCHLQAPALMPLTLAVALATAVSRAVLSAANRQSAAKRQSADEVKQ
ncbi:chloride channel protein [Bombiscardovia apis]|uniref:Chloride channel protein n=1 Tax=Bombiscardovia apis TaxID=2932182 RepID=A0ABN6SGD8_9BIFI|nr:chloride channel protein [Bombiscardovia apis]BDR53950.1 chloride channel protein [Bombiscardovia apis]